MAKHNKQFDFSIWRKLDIRQKKQYYEGIRKTANRRLRRLRESGFAVPIETQDYLEDIGRKFFPSINKIQEEWKINSFLLNTERFLNNRRSTISGTREVISEVLQSIETRLNQFREDKISLNYRNIDKRNFYNFLHSNQFKRLKHDIDSDIAIEEYNDALSDGFSHTEIMDMYNEWLEDELTLQEMQAERKLRAEEIKDTQQKSKKKRRR